MEDLVYKPPLLLLSLHNFRRNDIGRRARKKRCPLTRAKFGSLTVIKSSASSPAVPMAGSTRQEANFQVIRRSLPSRSKAFFLSPRSQGPSAKEYYLTRFNWTPHRFKPDKEGEIIQYTGISQSACREMAVSLSLISPS